MWESIEPFDSPDLQLMRKDSQQTCFDKMNPIATSVLPNIALVEKLTGWPIYMHVEVGVLMLVLALLIG